jgi:hypothetical protein
MAASAEPADQVPGAVVDVELDEPSSAAAPAAAAKHGPAKTKPAAAKPAKQTESYDPLMQRR